MTRTLLCLLVFISVQLFGQSDTLFFSNPSFEYGAAIKKGNRKYSFVETISYCGFVNHPTPYTNNENREPFLYPADGENYLVLTVSDENIWQTFSQSTSSIFEKGKCYSFTAALASTKSLRQWNSITNSYALQKDPEPILLRVYLGKRRCDMGQLIGFTHLLSNQQWQDFQFNFEPDDFYSTVTFEVYYQAATINYYNGNILIDHLSPIVQIDCEHANYFDQTLKDRFVNAKKIRHLELDEQRKIYKERMNTAYTILKEKVSELADIGLFMENSKGINPESKVLINNVIELLKTNKGVGVDFGIKKVEGRSLRKWRIDYLNDTFSLSGVEKHQFDADKIGQYLEIDWDFDTPFMSIYVYKIQ